MDALPSEEMLWIDWAFLMPAELLWLAAAFATGLINLRESMIGVRFFWIKRWPVVLSEPWDSSCLPWLLSSMRGRTSEIRGRTTPLVVLLSLLLFEGNENPVLVKKKKKWKCNVMFFLSEVQKSLAIEVTVRRDLFSWWLSYLLVEFWERNFDDMLSEIFGVILAGLSAKRIKNMRTHTYNKEKCVKQIVNMTNTLPGLLRSDRFAKCLFRKASWSGVWGIGVWTSFFLKLSSSSSSRSSISSSEEFPSTLRGSVGSESTTKTKISTRFSYQRPIASTAFTNWLCKSFCFVFSTFSRVLGAREMTAGILHRAGTVRTLLLRTRVHFSTSHSMGQLFHLILTMYK